MIDTEAESCISAESDGIVNDEEDRAEALDLQLIRLLDSVDHLLLLRHSLAQTFSQGWMEIARARYAMGPSRISEPLLSLKACPASAVVSVTIPSRDTFDLKGENQSLEDCADDGEAVVDGSCPMGFTLHKRTKDEKTSVPVGGKTGIDRNERAGGGDLASDSFLKDEDGMNKKKHKSEPLFWFGTLVSPHLRAAQCSFGRALETLIELANAQSTILSTLPHISIDDEGPDSGTTMANTSI